VEGLRYADSGGHQLAYRVRDGADDRDIVLFTPGGTIPMDFLERDRVGVRLLAGLAAIGRLVLFDRRGIGLSDPITTWSEPLVEQWAADLATIVATACPRAPVVVSLGDYWGPARLFAASHPEALSALVLYEPTGPNRAVQLSPSVTEGLGDDWIARVCPSRAGEHAFREWFDSAGRTGASPSVAARIYEVPPEKCIRRLAAAQRRIAVPTLVLRRPANLLGSPAAPDPVSQSIRGSRRVDLPGTDYHWLGSDVDSLLVEISRFVTGQTRLPTPERALCAVLFTDIVGSTKRAATLGDARWKAVLDRHDEAIRDEVARSGGVVLKTTGDGVLATVPSADGALRAAASIRARLANDGLQVRIGVHVGDVERRGQDVAGVAVHIAARLMALAGPGQIFVTASVPIAVAGTDHAFELVGDHALRDVPGSWTVFRDVTTPALP
jgi:class 3 adenylate cyclase